MRRTVSIFVMAICVTAMCVEVHAKTPPEIEAAVLSNYPPAVPSRALDTAHEELDPATLRGFVVLRRGGVPAERARFFISWQQYDYRGVVVHLDKDGKMTTRRDTPYTYLKRGDVLAVAGLKFFRQTVYLKLISAEVYTPENRRADKRHSRVTTMLGFKFPGAVFKRDDSEEVMGGIEDWLKPFTSLAAAQAYAAKIRAGDMMEAAAESGAKAAVEAERSAEAIAEERAEAVVETGEGKREKRRAARTERKLDALELKIERAKRQMEEAAREMEELKEEVGRE